MRDRVMVLLLAGSLLAALALPGIASADKGGCPNSQAQNGAAHANPNSAHWTSRAACAPPEGG